MKKEIKMRRIPSLRHFGRSYSERSPLNPHAGVGGEGDTSTGSASGATGTAGVRGISYGTLSPYFGFIRSSLWRSNSMQVTDKGFLQMLHSLIV